MKKKTLFELASRNKTRFEFKGLISVEDLWDLSLTELDSIFKSLNSKLKSTKEESLLDTKTAKDEEVELQIELVKHIVETKIKERDEKVNAAVRAQDLAKYENLLAEKKDAELKDLDIEEIEERIKALKKII